MHLPDMLTARTVATFATHIRNEIGNFPAPNFRSRGVASNTIRQRFAADNVPEVVNFFVNRFVILPGSQAECSSRNFGSVSSGV